MVMELEMVMVKGNGKANGNGNGSAKIVKKRHVPASSKGCATPKQQL